MCAALLSAINWYGAWALPGLGMFSEAYIIFASGQIGPFQREIWPQCYVSFTDCKENMVKHIGGYIQIVGIMLGMMVWGILADSTGRKWGSRVVACLMLSGCLMLTFTPYAWSAWGYFSLFMFAQAWYGFGVGGEYPLASSSAAERASSSPELQKYRGRQVMLVFSNQGMGNLINGIVILIAMAWYGQTESLDPEGSKGVLVMMYGFGTVVCLVMVAHRALFLEESEMYAADHKQEESLEKSKRSFLHKHMVSCKAFWPRQLVASLAWVANDFAFYGNKLFQSTFIKMLYPDSTQFEQQQWNVLNSFVALLGYYAAAIMVDKPWYGRRLMQNVGFSAMSVLYLICYLKYDYLTQSTTGLKLFQGIYYLSSFFNQFGPNGTTWLVAGEMFPTDVRAANHGFAATMGKLGAIIAGLWFSYVGHRMIFLLSSMFAIMGVLVTTIWLADTTGLELGEYDRMQRCLLEGRFHKYHGEAVNPKHLSFWEIKVLKWHKNYNPNDDQVDQCSSLLEKSQSAAMLGGVQMTNVGVPPFKLSQEEQIHRNEEFTRFT